MILSPGRKFLFIHIPKTGGTSMALALEARAMADDVMAGDTPKAVRRRKRAKALPARGRVWKHSTLRDLDGVPGLGDLFVFTLVRNPWDRMVSYYTWLREQTWSHPAVDLAKTRRFSEFLNHPDTRRTIQANPYESYVTDAAGQMRCDLFIRLEHLATDMVPLCAHLGFEPELPHANRSARAASYRDSYSESDANLVAELCAADIARFDYRFDS